MAFPDAATAEPLSPYKREDLGGSLDRAAGGKAEIITGGADLIGRLKDNILPTYPTALIDIKTIPGLDYINRITPCHLGPRISRAIGDLKLLAAAG